MAQTNARTRQAVMRNRWVGIGSFAMIFCIIASLAMVHENSIFGFSPGKAADKDKVDPVRMTGQGEVINTTQLGDKILGYGGTVPLEIYVRSGRIDSIKALPNNETSEVFQRLYDEGLMKAWNGHTLSEAASLEVDAVSGATYSSNAVIRNVRAGADYALGMHSAQSGGFGADISLVAALLVILAGAIVPLAAHPGPRYRLIQQILNVAILGFWAGVFIDYAMMLNFFAHGFTFSLAGVVTILLLIVGLIYPVLNKPGHYCAWICPFGSLQEMAGKVQKHKIRISSRMLWVVLLSLLFIGFGCQWIDYEIFTGFLVMSASWVVICIGVLFIALSVFVNRPFCRFVCPTGTLLRNS